MQKKVLYLQFTNPAAYPPLEHSSRILANHGWRVLFLGIGALGGADTFEFLPHPAIEVRRLPFVPPGWRQRLLYLRFLVWVLFWVVRWRPHWIYASDLYTCPIALIISLLPGIRVIYHEHDSPSEATSDQTRFIQFALATRQQLARRAAFCVLPNAQRSAVFREQTQTDRPVLTVWNCPRLDEVVTELNSRDTASGRVKLYYHGTIVPPRIPSAVLQALAQLGGQAELFVLGYETSGAIGYSVELAALAQKLSIQDEVTIDIKGRSRNEIFTASSQHDVGLALISTESLQSVNHRYFIGASNKPFDYMASGLALLVPNLNDWVTAYVEPGYGLACNPDDPESIAAALRWFIKHPEERQAMGERGRQRILTEWNYEKQFQPVLERMTNN